MKTFDNKCRECGTELKDKNARDVGYCLSCYNMMMADPDDDYTDDDYEKTNKKGIPSHWPVRADEDDI